MVEGGGGGFRRGDGGEPTLLDAPHLCNQCSPFVFYQHKLNNDFFLLFVWKGNTTHLRLVCDYFIKNPNHLLRLLFGLPGRDGVTRV